MTAPITRQASVAVIGAGMAGLAAAAELRDAGVAATVFEREVTVGGRIKTIGVDDATVDLGAQSIAPFCTDTLDAARDAGLGKDLVVRRQRMAVVRDGEECPIESPLELARSGLLSTASRVRALRLLAPVTRSWSILDPVELAQAASIDDCSAHDLVTRLTDREVTSHVVAPLLRALLYWDLATTSQVPLLATLKAAKSGNTPFRLHGGMTRLPAALADALDVRTGCRVTRVEPRGSVYELLAEGEDGQTTERSFDGIICAMTASAAATVVDGLPRATARFLASVEYSRTRCFVFTVAPGTATPRSPLTFPTDSVHLLASVNPLWSGRPLGATGIVKVYLSDAGYGEFDGLDDAEAAAAALAALRDAGVRDRWVTEARLACGWRWPEALPRFPVGYLRTPALQDAAALDVGTLVFAGDYLLAPHLEGALRSGRRAARRLIAKFRDQRG